MDKHTNEILKHIQMVSGNNLIARSVDYFLKHNELTATAIVDMAKQLKNQIHDNPEMMQEILTNENYVFFSKCTLD